MSKTLRSQLLSAEELFLSSVILGSDAIEAFNRDWVSLLSDLNTAIEMQQVDQETLTIAHVITSRVVIYAESLHRLECETGKALATLESEAHQVLLDNEVDTSPTRHPSSFPPPSPPLPPFSVLSAHNDTDHESPERASLHLIAHLWLLQNLCDPYPSITETASLAENCGCSVKAVQDWFSSARRRIGWTDLCREIFGGSRRETSQAATRLFTEGLDNGLSSDIKRAFSAIRVNAQNLLQKITTEGEETDGSTSLAMLEEVLPKAPDSVHDLSLASIVDEDEEDMTPPPLIAGCKRTLVTAEDPGTETTFPMVALDRRPRKRHRSLSPPCIGQVLSVPSVIPVPESNPPSMTIDDSAAIPSNRSRKRRLSDASSEELRKRPRALHGGLRRQLVSDPLPVTSRNEALSALFSEEWFKATFDMSRTVDISGLESSAFFDIGRIEHTSVTRSHCGMDSHLTTVSPTCQFDISDADLVKALVDSFDLLSPNAPNSSPSTVGQAEALDGQSIPLSSEETNDPFTYEAISDSFFDWSQFDDAVRLTGSSSPTPSLTSLSSDSSASSFPESLHKDSSFMPIGYPLEADTASSLQYCLSDLSSELPPSSLSSESFF